MLESHVFVTKEGSAMKEKWWIFLVIGVVVLLGVVAYVSVSLGRDSKVRSTKGSTVKPSSALKMRLKIWEARSRARLAEQAAR